MKIIWLSNAPWAATGYGNQTRLFCPRIAALGHELAMCAFYGLEGGILNWGGIPIYPKGYHPYGQDVISAHAKHFQADIAISLIDAWVCEPDMHGREMRWVPWYPVDMDPIPPPVLRKLKRAYQPICYSHYGETKSREGGLDPIYIPHGVDTKTFCPGDKREARKALDLPPDAYIVGMVAANKGMPSRKAFPESFAAFAAFKKEHPDALLYVHSCMGARGENGGVNLPELAHHLGLKPGKDVLFSDQYVNYLGFPDPHMVGLYRSFDVLLAASMGEGFGIPILEAQACGCPVIVGDWTSMPELCFGGWKVPISEAERYWTPLAAYQFLPHVPALTEMIEAAYERSDDALVRSDAREGSLGYDADLVTAEYWKPALEEMAERIKEGAGEIQLVKFGEAA